MPVFYTKKQETNTLRIYSRLKDGFNIRRFYLNTLCSYDTVSNTNDGYLQINMIRAYVLRDLFTNEVVCPGYYGTDLKRQVEELAAAGDIRYESTLFSKPEQDYLNYILNKSEFSNGLDLRNKYSHDTCSLDEKTQINDYMELLKIMVLIIIKINEEFCVNKPIRELAQ